MNNQQNNVPCIFNIHFYTICFSFMIVTLSLVIVIPELITAVNQYNLYGYFSFSDEEIIIIATTLFVGMIFIVFGIQVLIEYIGIRRSMTTVVIYVDDLISIVDNNSRANTGVPVKDKDVINTL